jgi:hypothetical protein
VRLSEQQEALKRQKAEIEAQKEEERKQMQSLFIKAA